MRLDALKQVLERNIAANLQLVSRAGGLLRAARDMAAQPDRRARADVGALAAEWIKLNVDFCSRMSDQSMQYLNAVVSLAEEALGARPPTAAPNAALAAAEIKVSGRRGQVISVPFQLENPSAQPMSLSFEVRDLFADDGSKAGAEHITIEPAALSLNANSQQLVQALINLTAAFRAEQTYTSIVRVVGFPGKAIRLVVTVLADEPAGGNRTV